MNLCNILISGITHVLPSFLSFRFYSISLHLTWTAVKGCEQCRIEKSSIISRTSSLQWRLELCSFKAAIPRTNNCLTWHPLMWGINGDMIGSQLPSMVNHDFSVRHEYATMYSFDLPYQLWSMLKRFQIGPECC